MNCQVNLFKNYYVLPHLAFINSLIPLYFFPSYIIIFNFGQLLKISLAISPEQLANFSSLLLSDLEIITFFYFKQSAKAYKSTFSEIVISSNCVHP